MMRLLAGLVLLGLGVVLGGPPAQAAGDRSTPAPLNLRVMTFNLRYASDRPPNSWPERRPVMKKLILADDVRRLGKGQMLVKTPGLED